MVEEAKVIVVEETNERLATGKKIGGGCLFVNFRPWFLLSQGMESTPIYKGGRGRFCLYWCQILAIDSNRKDLNRWFKVAIMKCQILATEGYLSWPLWGNAKDVIVSIG